MRSAVGAFGVIAALVTVLLVGRYGYLSADNDTDGLIMAFFFGVVATGGLAGHGAAVWVGRHNWLVGLIVGLVAIAALTVNLSNSLGAIAGRTDKAQAERVKARESARDERAERDRLAAERSKLPAFAPATSASVEVARVQVAAAERTRVAECGNGDPRQRGVNCRLRETEEQAARTALVTAISNRSLTEQAERLEAALEAARGRVQRAAPNQSDNAEAKVLAKLFSIAVDDAATWKQLALAFIVELLIVAALLAFEIMRPAPEVAQPSAAVARDPPRPLDPIDFLMEHLQPSRRGRVEVGELYGAYAAKCAARGAAAVEPEQFEAPLLQLGLPRVIEGDKVYLMKVQLAA